MPQNKTLQNCFCFVEREVVEWLKCVVKSLLMSSSQIGPANMSQNKPQKTGKSVKKSNYFVEQQKLSLHVAMEELQNSAEKEEM